MIKGPNIMTGYLDQPEKTAAVVRDGWYDTGDFARLDEEGFIEITGRQSRFSKIGGEMVPHIKVEEELIRCIEELEAELPAAATNGEPHEEDEEHRAELRIAVTSVPDERKGERLIVLHKPLPVSVDAVLKRMGNAGLPNLWLPGADSFLEVQEIPLLGTGKLDLRGVQDVALAAFAPQETVTS